MWPILKVCVLKIMILLSAEIKIGWRDLFELSYDSNLSYNIYEQLVDLEDNYSRSDRSPGMSGISSTNDLNYLHIPSIECASELHLDHQFYKRH
jgi:hypothetical protein